MKRKNLSRLLGRLNIFQGKKDTPPKNAFRLTSFDRRGNPIIDGKRVPTMSTKASSPSFRTGRMLSLADFFSTMFAKFGKDQPLSDPYKQLPAIYACVRSRSVPIAMVPLRVYEWTKDTKGNDILEPNPDHPLQTVLDNPNPITSKYQLVEGSEANLCLNGNFLWLLERERPTDVPERIWPLPPDNVTYEPDPRTGLPMLWKYKPNPQAKEIIYQPFQIIHGSTFNPSDPIWGMPILEAASMASTQDWDSMRYNDSFLNNECNPGGRIKAEMGLTKDQEEELLAQFQHRHRGPSKAFMPEIYEGGLEWIPAQIPHKDMQFMDQREWNLQDIRMVFGVGKVQLGLTDGVNFATAHVQERLFWTQTLIPEIRLIEDSFWQTFRWIDNGNIEVLFDLSQVKALQIDIAEKADAARTFWAMGAPFEQVNERLELGFKEFEGWDRSYFEMAGQAFDVQTGLPAQSASSPIPSSKSVAREKTPVIPIIEEGKLLSSIEECCEYLEKYEYATILPHERDFRDKVSRWFIEYRTEALKRFGEATGYKGKSIETGATKANEELLAIIEELLPKTEKWQNKIAKLTKKVYESSLLSGAKARATEMGVSPVVQLIRAKEASWIETVCLNKIKGVEATTREFLRDALIDGIEAGETLEELSGRIKEVLKERRSDSMTIARTEVGRASERGAYVESAESGIVQGHFWIVSGLNIRESHVAMHGQYRDLGDPFVTGNGVKLMHPIDPMGDPTEVVNCKCHLLAQTKEL